MSAEKQTLSNRQDTLMSLIFSGSDRVAVEATDKAGKGLEIYQNNLLMTAARALTLSFPVLNKMLGEQVMRMLAGRYLQMEPPATGDWGQWGADLPQLIRKSTLHSEYPFMAGVAELEWRLHLANRSQTPELNAASLSLLADPELDQLVFFPAAGLSLMESEYPLDQLWQLHQPSTNQIDPDSNQLLELLNADHVTGRFLIFQHQHLARIERLSEQEYRWMQDLIAGATVSELLDRHQQFDFASWLSRAVEQQWITGIKKFSRSSLS